MFCFRRASLSRLRPPRRVSRNSLSAGQRATGWFSVVLYSVLALGFPLPLDAAPNSGEVFPCMHHRCGCHSAEQCWRDCCCMSMVEKIVWARENNVTPPDYVLGGAMAKGSNDEEPAAKCCCCSSKPAKPCCEAESSVGRCRPPKSPAESDAPANAEAKPGLRGIVLLSALKCRGVADGWTGAPFSLSPPPPVVCGGVGEIVGTITTLKPEFSTQEVSPPIPPPRFYIA